MHVFSDISAFLFRGVQVHCFGARVWRPAGSIHTTLLPHTRYARAGLLKGELFKVMKQAMFNLGSSAACKHSVNHGDSAAYEYTTKPPTPPHSPATTTPHFIKTDILC